MPVDLKTHQALELDKPIRAEVNGRTSGYTNEPAWDTAYHPCPGAFSDTAVEAGPVIKFALLASKYSVSGETRNLWSRRFNICRHSALGLA